MISKNQHIHQYNFTRPNQKSAIAKYLKYFKINLTTNKSRIKNIPNKPGRGMRNVGLPRQIA